MEIKYRNPDPEDENTFSFYFHNDQYSLNVFLQFIF